jgi:hypothetical protein
MSKLNDVDLRPPYDEIIKSCLIMGTPYYDAILRPPYNGECVVLRHLNRVLGKDITILVYNIILHERVKALNKEYHQRVIEQIYQGLPLYLKMTWPDNLHNTERARFFNHRTHKEGNIWNSRFPYVPVAKLPTNY